MTTPLSNLPPFKPTSVGGCALWLDAADPTSLTLSSGSNVTLWKDKSGNGYNPIKTGTVTYNSTNLNGKGSLNTTSGQFNGTFNYQSAHTTFLVMNMISAPSDGSPMFSLNQPGTNTRDLDYAFNTFRMVLFNPSLYYVTTPSFTSTYFITTSYQSSSLISLTLNGGTAITTACTADSNPNTGYNVGNFPGYISEVIYYNTVLTTQQRQQIEGYLAWKWGLQAQLPSSHPYYKINTAPTNTLIQIPPIPNYYSTIPFSEKNVSFYSLFQPTSVGGCALWLDAADASTITTSGGYITTWNDKSGNAQTATAANATAVYTPKLLNGNSGIVVTAAAAPQFTTPSFVLSPTSTISVFIVLNLTSQNNLFFITSTTLANFYMGADVGTNAYNWQINSADKYPVYTFPLTGSTIIVELIYDATTGSTYINGGSKVSYAVSSGTSLTASQQLRILYLNYMSGQLFEVLFFNTALTTTQRQQIEGYLAWKWGLQANLPSNHPYYSNERLLLYPNITVPRPPVFSVQRNYVKWRPTNVGGCALWIDAADASTVTKTGGTVSSVLDKSGNGYNLTGGTGFTYPNNTFNGTYPSFYNNSISSGYYVGKNTSLNLSQPITIFNVSVAIAGTTGGLIDSTTSGKCSIYVSVGILYYYAGTTSISSGQTQSTNAVMATLYNGSTSYAWYNGTQIQANMNPGSGGLTSGIIIGNIHTIDGPDNWQGHICEVIIYQGILTTQQRQQVEGYLAWKWGLKTQLPTAHPYRYIPVS